MVAYLAENSNIEVIYPKNELLANISIGPLYYKTDTHWTDLGAFVSYQKLTSTLKNYFPLIELLPPLSQLNFSYILSQGNGDLADMSALKGELFDWKIDFPIINRVSYASPEPNPRMIITKHSNPILPKAIIYRDSFFSALLPFMANNFSQAYYLWDSNLNSIFIKQQQPNVVILEIVERMIGTLLNIPEPK